ncbi:MAG TPA: hypothetical protein K8V90_07700 [Romboutsia timonensis]|uniref:Uncharacterized protein n=1 Tax=Romboutsia timonensis TaxID=1776391 RepID=A0A921N0Z7_9FIRM|nr:hypothetical protein [Romboutsia timonensis]
MTTKDKIDLSSIPTDVLIAEIEARKDDETRQHVTEINNRLAKLKTLGFTPYNRDVLENVDEKWDLVSLGVNVRSGKVISVYFDEIRTEED